MTTRRPPPSPQPDQQVETTKIDPRGFLEGALPTGIPTARQSRAETDRELEPIDVRKVPVREAQERQAEKEAQKQAAENFLPPQEEKDVLEETVKGDLISRLEERFGMKPEVLHDVMLEAGGEDLKVSLRLPLYDDFIWAISVIERQVKSGEGLALMETETQREHMLKHLSSCRSLAKIEDEWVWDILGLRGAIMAVTPGWDGESMVRVPDAYQGVMAKQVYELFRQRLHPDLLFDLNRKTEDLLEKHGPAKQNAKDEADRDGDDPTEAA